jgi:hypothetical protein
MAKKLLLKKWESGCLEKRSNKNSIVDLKRKVRQSLGGTGMPPICKNKK